MTNIQLLYTDLQLEVMGYSAGVEYARDVSDIDTPPEGMTSTQQMFWMRGFVRGCDEFGEVRVVQNLMSGKDVVQNINTPLCCDVSSETYWSI